MLEACVPLSPLMSLRANDFGGAGCVEAVHKGDVDVDFGGLAIRVSCHDTLAEGLEASHRAERKDTGMTSGRGESSSDGARTFSTALTVVGFQVGKRAGVWLPSEECGLTLL